MVPTLFFYQLGLVALVCVFLMLCWLWPNDAASPHQPIMPTKPSRRKRSKEPKPFAGLTQRPPCALCEREATQAHEPPPAPPEPMPPTTRRPRTVETSQHFCPHGGCRYRGWLGRGNLRGKRNKKVAVSVVMLCSPKYPTESFLTQCWDNTSSTSNRFSWRLPYDLMR